MVSQLALQSYFIYKGFNHENIFTDERCSITCKYCTFVGNLEDHKCDQSLLNVDYETIQNKWICYTCHNMMFDSEEEYNKHKSSRRHTLCFLNPEKGNTILKDLEHFYCVLCNIQYKNMKEYTDHHFEEKHLSLASTEVFLENKVDLFQCNICNIFMDEEAKDEHIKDRKHLLKENKKYTMDFLSEVANKEILTTNYQCHDCNIAFPNFMSFSDHFLHDASHIDKVINKKLCQN